MNDTLRQYKDQRSAEEIAESRQKRKIVVEEKDINVNAIVEHAKKPLQNKIAILEKKLKRESYLVNEYKKVIAKLTNQIANRNK